MAVEIVGDCWPELIRMMLAAARPSLVSQPISWGTDPIAVITPQALLGAGPAHARAPSMLWQFRIRGRADALDTQDGACAARILLDVGMLYRRLIETLTSHDISTGLLDAEIDALLMRDGWMPGDGARCNSEPEPIVRPMTVRRRGDRLVEADYFFSRSLAVLEQMGDGGCGGGERSLRYLRYIGDPAPRERWKAWLRLAGTDIPFAWAFAAVARAVGSEDCLGFPETFITGAEAMLNRAGLDSLAKRIAVLQQTARLGKELEIAEA
ncbi:MAG: hypothetical protein JOZ16_06540 [Methylobacteriaceae bacterium]|nr:hypothetical protein [Methylobacteriaceae bacterium]